MNYADKNGLDEAVDMERRAATELSDLYGAYLIFRDSDQGVEGFRKYMRRAFDPTVPGFDQAISEIIAKFGQHAAVETKAIH